MNSKFRKIHCTNTGNVYSILTLIVKYFNHPQRVSSDCVAVSHIIENGWGLQLPWSVFNRFLFNRYSYGGPVTNSVFVRHEDMISADRNNSMRIIGYISNLLMEGVVLNTVHSSFLCVFNSIYWILKHRYNFYSKDKWYECTQMTLYIIHAQPICSVM